MSVAAEFTFFPEQRPAVMVVSHERSGTHFLMNALASCYGYVSLPWIDLDNPKQSVLDFHSREQLGKILANLAEKPMANIVKAHQTAEFFSDQLEALSKRYTIFAIYRDPVPVMLSFWRYMYRFRPEIDPGPKAADPLTFARTAPAGLMLRYQLQRCDSVLDRWAHHVNSWLAAAPNYPNIRLVRYEDLDLHFETTMKSFASLLGRDPFSISRPSRDYNVIPLGPNDPILNGASPDIEALRRHCRERVGETMARLGY